MIHGFILSHWCTSRRRLWRRPIRGNLKMVFRELLCRTGVREVAIVRWSVLQGAGSLDLLFPDILREFQKPEWRRRTGRKDEFECYLRGK